MTAPLKTRRQGARGARSWHSLASSRGSFVPSAIHLFSHPAQPTRLAGLAKDASPARRRARLTFVETELSIRLLCAKGVERSNSHRAPGGHLMLLDIRIPCRDYRRVADQDRLQR